MGCGLLVIWGGCAGSSLRRQPDTGGLSPLSDSSGGPAAHQHLFKVHYDGPQGSGSLRLVLRTQADGLFQITTADTLGRPLWSVEAGDSSTVFLDHRQQIYCLGEDEVRLREVTLEMFPLPAVPRLLLGQLPVDLTEVSGEGESAEYRDTHGRRWSVRTESDRPVAWTLWVTDAPTLWWTREGKGGILSHRDGSQFRWRQVVDEATESKLRPLAPPESFRQVSCDAYDLPEFRQDQPAPPGDGASG